MKIVFVIISFLSITYLLAQTSTVKTASLDIYKSLSGNETRKAEQSALNVNHIENLMNRYQAIKDENVAMNRAFEDKIVSLEQEIVTLQQRLDLLNKPLLVNKASDTAPEPHLLQPAHSKEMQIETTIEAVIDKRNNEQHKRLKQQAVLRQIAEKMELSALNSLQAQ